MKFLGTTLFASALALFAGCSSGSSEAPIAAEAARNTESLLAPSHGEPDDDPCAAVRCREGTECVVVDGNATCAESDADINPCAAVLCVVGTSCEVIDGEPVCTPIEPSACAAVLCVVGTSCEVIDGEPVCTPIEPAGPACGGFAGLACPGAGSCVDDASDDCDPENGGADCGGLCVCPVIALCVEGFVFDDSPHVCACVEQEPDVDACATVRCAAGTECVVVDDRAICQPVTPNPCAAVTCPVGSSCEVVDGQGECVPQPETNPCALVDCFPNQTCAVIEGEAACVPLDETSPCATVLCAPGTVCVADGDEASCEPIEPGQECN